MPDASLKIILTAIDKASGPMKGFGGNLKALAGQVPGLGAAMGLLTNPITLVGAGLAATGKIMKDSINETMVYADQVRDLSRSLGTNAEESSKLIQVADDLFVSYGTLTVAMKTAQRQGINPNIEGLMGLAEKYQALKDPAERAAFALKTFGRSGLEMTKILEKTPAQLQAMGDALKGSSLIMSQDAVNAAYKYKQAMDNLGDTIQGVKYEIGNELIPVMAEYTDKLANTISGNLRYNKTEADMKRLLDLGVITKKQYKAAMDDVTTSVIFGSVRLTELGQAEAFADEKLKAYNDSNKDARDRIAELTPALEAGAGAFDELSVSYSDLARAADDAAVANSDLKYAIIDVGKAAMGREALDALKKAYDDGAISAEEYKARTGLVMSQWMEMPATEVAAGQALTLLKKDFDDGKISIYDYLTGLSGIRSNLDSMNGKTYKTFFELVTSGTNYHYTPPTGGGGGGGGGVTPAPTGRPGPGQPGFRGATGLDMIVPSGYPNDSAIYRATSGERVTIATPNQQGNNNRNNNNDVIAAIRGSRLDEKKLARMIRDAVLQVM